MDNATTRRRRFRRFVVPLAAAVLLATSFIVATNQTRTITGGL